MVLDHRHAGNQRPGRGHHGTSGPRPSKERQILSEGGVSDATNVGLSLSFDTSGDGSFIRIGDECYELSEAVINGV